MSIEFVLMVGIMICSLCTGLIVEAVKKMLEEENRPTNLIAAIVSIVVGLGFGIGYMLTKNLPFDVNNIVALVVLVIGSWLSALLGFDKVKQTIEQLFNNK